MREMPAAGYDPILSYSKEDITKMCLAAGSHTKDEMAKIAREIQGINRAEQRLWDKVRRYEIQADRLSLLVS